MTVGRVARYYSLGRAVLQMRVGEFFAWAEAMPELMRQEKLDRDESLILAGGRSVADADRKQWLFDRRNPIRKRRAKPVSPEQQAAFEAGVEDINQLWRKLASR